MKKLTKQYVDKIAAKIIKNRVALLKSCGFTDEEIRRRVEVSDVKDDVETAILEWEKYNNIIK